MRVHEDEQDFGRTGREWRRGVLIALAGLAISASSLQAQPACDGPIRVRRVDLTTSPTRDASPAAGGFAVVNGKVIFSANVPQIGGWALFASDGTAGGTTLVRSFPASGASAVQQVLGASSAAAYFTVGNSMARELWRTDGTPGGTTLVRSGFTPSTRVTLASAFVSTNARAIIFANDGIIGDGPSGPPMQTLLPPLGGTEYLSNVVALPDGSVVFAVSDDTVYVSKLYRSDGTAAGTTLLSTIQAVGYFTLARELFAFGGRVFFVAGTAATGPELFSTDGTPQGTGVAYEFYPGNPGQENPTIVGAAAGRLYMMANASGVNGSLTWTLRESAPTLPPQQMSSLFFQGVNSDVRNGYVLEVNGRALLMGADYSLPVNTGYEPYATDGTAAGTVRLIETTPDTLNLTTNRLAVRVAGGQRALFTAPGPGGTGTGLYTTDATPAGTSLLLGNTANGTTWSSHFLVSDGQRAWFPMNTSSTSFAMGVSDGTAAGTMIVGGAFPSRPAFLPGGKAVFSAVSPTAGIELFVSDGTPAGTSLLADLALGSADSNLRGPLAVGNTAVLMATQNGTGSTPRAHAWDGRSSTPTVLTPPPMPGGVAWSSIGAAWADGNFVTFLASVSGGWAGAGLVLAQTDGTTSGTQVLTRAPNGLGNVILPTSPAPEQAFARTVAGVFYPGVFTVPTSNMPAVGPTMTTGTELGFVSSPDSARLVADIEPGSNGSAVQIAKALPSGKVVFLANARQRGLEPWVTDGTEFGTQQLIDAIPGSAGVSTSTNDLGLKWCVFQGRGYLRVSSVNQPATPKLLVTDGTGVGTDFVPLGDLSLVDGPYASKRGLYVVATSPSQGAGVFLYVPGTSGSAGPWAKVLTLQSASQRPEAAMLAVDMDMYMPIIERAGGPAFLMINDGTPGGNTPIIVPHPAGQATGISAPIRVRDRIVFAATVGSSVALFQTRGTQASTCLIDLATRAPGAPLPTVSNFTAWGVGAGSRVVYIARDPLLGTEPHALDLCPADVDNNGQVDTPDVFAYLADWFAARPEADEDRDTTITLTDLFQFLSTWFRGCP